MSAVSLCMYLKSHSWIFVTFSGYFYWVFLYMMYMKSFPSAGRELFINQTFTLEGDICIEVFSAKLDRALDVKPLWVCKVVVSNTFSFLWLVTQFFSAEPTTKCTTMLSHMWSKKWTDTINLGHKKWLKIVQCSPRVVGNCVISWKYHVSNYISSEIFEWLVLFWQTNVFHMLHFSHKDFKHWKSLALLGSL